MRETNIEHDFTPLVIIEFPVRLSHKGLEPEKGGYVLAGTRRYNTQAQEKFRSLGGSIQVIGTSGYYALRVNEQGKPSYEAGGWGSKGAAVAEAKLQAEARSLAFDVRKDVIAIPI